MRIQTVNPPTIGTSTAKATNAPPNTAAAIRSARNIKLATTPCRM